MNLYNYKDPIKVDWVSEQCNIVREKAFREVDGFDERFFMFHEGPDLCRRIRNNGYTIWVDPRIHVSLLDGHTHNTKKRKQWMKESTHHYKKKHGASIY